ncbi:MAG: hypothetical protein WCP33_06235, partial [Deltaproteobacteria bacterium]
ILKCPYCKAIADQDTQNRFNPNLAACRDCKRPISLEAKVCPHCGCSNPAVTENSYIMGSAIIAILVVILGVFFFVRYQNASDEAQKHLNKASEAAEEAQKSLQDLQDKLKR